MEREIVEALNRIADSLDGVAKSIERLGLNGASGTPLGAIELLALEVKNGGEAIVGALRDTE